MIKTVLLTSLVVLFIATLITSQTAAVAKKEQQKLQAVDNPSSGKDVPVAQTDASGKVIPTTNNGKPTTSERIDIFIHGKKHSSGHSNSVAPTKATYITGTLVDCNVVFATPNYFSTLAIKLCNQQYGAR
jgi:hypothetical protein